jgi:hypothetical protein
VQRVDLEEQQAAGSGERGRVLELDHGLIRVSGAVQQTAGLELDARPDGRIGGLAKRFQQRPRRAEALLQPERPGLLREQLSPLGRSVRLRRRRPA